MKIVNISDQNLKKEAYNISIVRIVDTILEQAVLNNVSDLHFEPKINNIIIRQRSDGVLSEVLTLDKSLQTDLINRIKLLSGINPSGSNFPLEGKFKLSTPVFKAFIKVSIVPILDGEKISMKILNEEIKNKKIDDLGLSKNNLQILKEKLDKKEGLILVSGPKASGKSTTLYSLINYLNKAEVNIVTIENPIKTRLPKINQSQTSKQVNFEKGLLAFLKQDPDIIMLSEINSPKTAKLAVEAALTGHLVLSSLPEKKSSAVAYRLANIANPSLAASALKLVISQKLVRKICPDCIYSYKPTDQLFKELSESFSLKKAIDFLIKNNLISKKYSSFDNLTFYKGKGCKTCGHTGFRGQIAIYDFLEITPEIASLISKKSLSSEIESKALEQHSPSLIHDALIKALSGQTAIEEILQLN